MNRISADHPSTLTLEILAMRNTGPGWAEQAGPLHHSSVDLAPDPVLSDTVRHLIAVAAALDRSRSYIHQPTATGTRYEQDAGPLNKRWPRVISV